MHQIIQSLDLISLQEQRMMINISRCFVICITEGHWPIQNYFLFLYQGLERQLVTFPTS